MQTPHALMLLLVCIATGGEAFVALVPSIHRSRSPSCGSLHGVPIVPRTISTASSAARRATQPLAAISLDTKAVTSKPTAVYALIMTTFITFFVDNILRLPLCKSLYLYHSRWAWWQPLTAVFCHGSRAHLSGNVFLLLLFGRSVEDDLGWGGLLFAFVWCGVVANLVSLVILPATTVSLGASGAVFGLFTVSVLSRLSLRELDWRRVVEIVILGEFVVGKMLSEMKVAATGGLAGVNHVAHLAGAGSGIVLVVILRSLLNKMEKTEAKRSLK